MTELPEVDDDAYQDLETIRRRVDYDGTGLYSDNEQLRFDRLLVRLERESRGIFETLWGDETPLSQTERVDEIRATDDAALPLVYPITDVRTVEIKRSERADWRELNENRYTHSKHRLILAQRRRGSARGNPLADLATRTTWRDIAWRLRVTYDRGFGEEPPDDIKGIQIALINRMLRQLRQEQNIAGLSADEAGQLSGELDTVVTDDIRARISDVTKPGPATQSI